MRASERMCLGREKRLLAGCPLGWGLFNLIEGIIDHHILHIHHVTETSNHLTWDLTFLGSGALLIVVGLSVIRMRVMIGSVGESDSSQDAVT